MKALFFGSIDSVCDTSELQLEAFNQAFDEHRLGWFWDRRTFMKLQRIVGVQHRIRWYAEHIKGEELDFGTADRIQWRQSRIVEALISDGFSRARPGVLRLMAEADATGVKLGLISMAGQFNLKSLEAAIGDPFDLRRFAVIIDRSGADARVPASHVYRVALRSIGCEPASAMVVEDTEICTQAANDAGVPCIGTPNEFSLEQDFSRALACVDHLGDPGNAAHHRSGSLILDDGMVTLNSLACCVS